jgi:phosphoglycerate dehydrogenase-like enzyme
MIGAGVDSVLPAPELPERVLLANARGVHEPEMSEFALALILAVVKRLPMAMAQQHEHAWKLFGPHGLSGTTLGVLGLGAIGQAVARRAATLGMRVIGTRRHPEPVAGVAEVLPPSKTRRVLAESDVVIVVLPLTPETEGLLDAEAIAAMKPGAHLVNIARGGIVDEVALAEALREGRLGGAALDVFEQEPLPPTSPLWDTPNLLVTPHVAGLSHDYLARLGEIFFENIRRLERGEPIVNPVDRDRGY